MFNRFAVAFALILVSVPAFACGRCEVAGLSSWVCMQSEYTWCVSVCSGGTCTCTHGAGCGPGGGNEEPPLVAESEGPQPPPSPLTERFRGLGSNDAMALCRVTPGCTMYGEPTVAGPAVVVRGPLVTWGKIKRRFYR